MATGEQPPQGTPTPEQIAAYLESATHDDLVKIPVYNKRFQQVIAKANTEAEEIKTKARESLDQETALSQWANWLDPMPDAQRAAALKDPRAAQAWAVLQQRRSGRVNVDAVRYEAIKNALDSFRTGLSQEPDYADFDWSQFENEPDPVKALRTVVGHGAAKTLAGERGNMREEVTAQINEQLAARGMRSIQPDVLPSNGGNGGAPNAISAMSPQEKREMRLKDPQMYDQLVAQEMASLRGR